MKNKMRKSNKALLIAYGCAIVLTFTLVLSVKSTVRTYFPESAHVNVTTNM